MKMTNTELEEVSEKLFTYDVLHGGWVHENRGPEFNMVHVLKHLAQDLISKDFTDEDTVKNAIAPDSMQYAVRLTRWNGLKPKEALPLTGQAQTVLAVAKRFGSVPLHQVAFITAASALGRVLHPLDHEEVPRHDFDAMPHRTAMDAAALLIYSSELQADQYGFDLTDAFDQRIAQLRLRFGIGVDQSLKTR